MSFEFVDEKGNLIEERILIDAKVNGEYSGMKNDIAQKIITLDIEIRKQLLFELLTLEMNKKK